MTARSAHLEHIDEAMRAQKQEMRIDQIREQRDELRKALQAQVSKIDAWAADVNPAGAADALLAVGQIARAALAKVPA